MGVDPEVLAILDEAGLGHLADRFAAEDVDAATLRSLQEEDLCELGLDAPQRQALLVRLMRDGRPVAAGRQANMPAPAAVAAAEEALRRHAPAEALRYLRRADQALAGMGDAAADPLRLRALIARSAICRIQQGIASEEAGRLGRQVLELAQKLRETKGELIALTGLYTHALVRAEYFIAGKWAELLCERAAQAQDPTFRMIGRRGTGVVALHTGGLTQAVMALQEALDAYDVKQHLPLAHAQGYDHAEITSAFLSFARWITGDPAGGLRASEYSVSHSRHIGHMHSLAQALIFRSMLMAVSQDWDESLAAAREAEAVGHQHAVGVMCRASGFFHKAAQLAARPELPSPADLRALRHSHDEFRSVNPYNYQQVCGLMLATLHVRCGALAEAETAIAEAEAMQARTREIFLQPELMRMRATILQARGDDDGARAALAAALQEANRMGASMFALRIASDMAEAAPSPEARAQLAAVRGRLVSTDHGADLRRCAALLAGAA